MTREAGPHAVILAGGKGTRLRPYTTVLPKPLVPIGDDCAVLEILMRQLARQGFESVTLTIGHLASLIQAYVGDGSQWGVRVRYAVESTPLGTMGPVVAVLDTLPDHFLVLNGDVLTDLDFAGLLERHAASGSPLTVATFQRDVDVDFGVMEVRDGSIIGFTEKPTLSYAVSMGVYALSRQTLAGFEPGRPFGFDELMLRLIERGEHPVSHTHAGYWFDIGRPEDYDRANQDFERLRSTLLPDS